MAKRKRNPEEFESALGRLNSDLENKLDVLKESQDTSTEEEESDFRLRLQECERKIRRGIRSFFAVGEALKEIRDKNLYKEEFPNFEAYCEEKWSFKRRQAYYLIQASEIMDNLQSVHHGAQFLMPSSERQVRPLKRLKPEEQSAVWQEVVDEAERSGKGITNKMVEEKVQQYSGTETEQEAPKSVDTEAQKAKEERQLFRAGTTDFVESITVTLPGSYLLMNNLEALWQEKTGRIEAVGFSDRIEVTLKQARELGIVD